MVLTIDPFSDPVNKASYGLSCPPGSQAGPVMQGRRVVGGRVIRDRRAGAFVEFPIGDEPGLGAAQFRRHEGLNLTRRARHVPQAELIEGAVELLPAGALPPNLQGRRQILHRDIRGDC